VAIVRRHNRVSTFAPNRTKRTRLAAKNLEPTVVEQCFTLDITYVDKTAVYLGVPVR
jgi:hypothetical protein